MEVGPYVPGGTQEVNVIIESAFANRWGFQLAARQASDPALPAGTLEALNQFARVRCADGDAPPCDAGELEYATHTSAAPVGRGGQFIFTLNWTSPGQDVGEVIFTASALAADGDLGTNNDATAVTTTRSLFAPSNSPQLNTGGVVSAASLGSGVQTISPLALVSVFGLQLATPDQAVNVSTSDFDPRGRIPEELNRISLEFTTAGDPRVRTGRIIFVDEDQVNAQVPDLPVDPQATDPQVMVQAVINRGRGGNEVRSNMVAAAVAPEAPGLFTLNSSGQGEVAAVTAAGFVVSSQGVTPSSRPVMPGETVLVFGTGFGALETALEPGELASGQNRLTGPVTVTIGGTQLMATEVAYAGAAPNFAGLTQFNLTIPPGLPPGDHETRIRTGPMGEFVTQPGATIAVGQ